MRQRESEAQRRAWRNSDPDWRECTEKIEHIAASLDAQGLWSFIAGGKDASGLQVPEQQGSAGRDSGKWSFAYSILKVENRPRVQVLVEKWKAASAQLEELQRKAEPRGSTRSIRIPPKYSPPRIIGDVRELRLYRNQASTSWIASSMEGMNVLERFTLPRLARIRDGDAPHGEDASAIRDIVVQQADTWLGLLIAKDYPKAARLFFGGELPAPFLDLDKTDKDDSFETIEAADSTSEAMFDLSNPHKALAAIKRYATYLVDAESEQGRHEIRIRLAHETRRVNAIKQDGKSELYALCRNGLFIEPAASSVELVVIGRRGGPMAWARLKSNRDTLFRVGRYEVCRLGTKKLG